MTHIHSENVRAPISVTNENTNMPMVKQSTHDSRYTGMLQRGDISQLDRRFFQCAPESLAPNQFVPQRKKLKVALFGS
jgi:hypothetical protein